MKVHLVLKAAGGQVQERTLSLNTAADATASQLLRAVLAQMPGRTAAELLVVRSKPSKDAGPAEFYRAHEVRAPPCSAVPP